MQICSSTFQKDGLSLGRLHMQGRHPLSDITARGMHCPAEGRLLLQDSGTSPVTSPICPEFSSLCPALPGFIRSRPQSRITRITLG